MPTAKPLNTIVVNDYPKLIYTTKAYRTLLAMMATTHAKTKEFMFLGFVEQSGKDYIVEDFFLVPQHMCSGAYCETSDRYDTWINEAVPLDKRRLIRLHGHSHVNMPTSPSGTDDNQIKELCVNVSNYFIQLIINHNMNNTVNIWDKTNNLIYSNIEQYIKINNSLIKVTNKTSPVFPKFNITDGAYRIKNGMLLLPLEGNNYAAYDFENHSFMLYDHELIITSKSITCFDKEKHDNYIKTLEAQTEDLIEKPAVAYTQQSLYDSPHDYYGRNYSSYKNEDDHVNSYKHMIVKYKFKNNSNLFAKNYKYFTDFILKNASSIVESVSYMGKTYTKRATTKIPDKPYHVTEVGKKTIISITEKEYLENYEKYTVVESWCPLVNRFVKGTEIFWLGE